MPVNRNPRSVIPFMLLWLSLGQMECIFSNLCCKPIVCPECFLIAQRAHQHLCIRSRCRSDWAYLAVPAVTERGTSILCRLQPQLVFDFAAKAGPGVDWHV